MRNPRSAVAGLFLVLLAVATPVPAQQPDITSGWRLVPVPSTWKQAGGDSAEATGIGWYRCFVEVPSDWQGVDLSLYVMGLGDAYEVYFNGERVAGDGTFPPAEGQSSRSNRLTSYTIPADVLRAGEYNVLALRVAGTEGSGGFTGVAPFLAEERKAIDLKGNWQFRLGDDKSWAGVELVDSPGLASYSKRIDTADLVRQAAEGEDAPALSPSESLATFTVPDDLQLDLVLSEPVIAQPLHVDFDERGRLWLVEYRQYPYPEGLRMLSRDSYWRAVYDKMPEPPPHGTRGADRISIHEDQDGDGVFETHKVFFDGLNIANSIERARGGVWVTNPPYLLFIPDHDNDDVPDGDPEVHLVGFGIEDTHSAANSLELGPDGWLYGAQGSTVSGSIKRPGIDDEKTPPVHSMGQLIWRYHPETREYEIFAEGGGNAYGVEIDRHGRVYSGHNGGNTRGFHYVQGGYYRKGFGKHGPLSNPYTFGFFEAMTHHSVPRFSHDFAIYDGTTLPEEYRGDLYGVEPLQGQIVRSDMQREGSSFRTEDLERVIESSDPWFRPVEISVGPDGGIYVCDFYEHQISHRQHFEGQIDRSNGRVYRLTAKDAEPLPPFDLGKLPSDELIDYLKHSDEWFRRQALKLLGDRKDESVLPTLKRWLAEDEGQTALEALWAIHVIGGWSEELALVALHHPNPMVRAWTVRLMGDDHEVSEAELVALVDLATREESVDVRSQLASTARRLSDEATLAIVRPLLLHDEDADDIHVPLLVWWAIEAKAEPARDELLTLLEDSRLWDHPLLAEHVLERLMRRYAAAGGRANLLACAKLLTLAPSDEATAKLMAGFEAAFAGRPLVALPQELIDALADAGGGSLALQLRQGRADALPKALAIVKNPKAEQADRIELIRVLGEIDRSDIVPTLLELLTSAPSDRFRQAVLASLSAYDDPAIARAALAGFPNASTGARDTTLALVASRAGWTKTLLEAVEEGQIPADLVPRDVVQRLLFHDDDEIAAAVEKLWGDVSGAPNAAMRAEAERLRGVVRSGRGDPYAGKPLFAEHCGKCHRLFGEGGSIGPDLTAFQRDDVQRMLDNIINPSAEVREGYENHLIFTADGRTLNGFLLEQDDQIVVLRGVDGQTVAVETDEIEVRKRLPTSLMPEGLLKTLTEQQVRDLFAYLRSSQPLND